MFEEAEPHPDAAEVMFRPAPSCRRDSANAPAHKAHPPGEALPSMRRVIKTETKGTQSSVANHLGEASPSAYLVPLRLRPASRHFNFRRGLSGGIPAHAGRVSLLLAAP